MFQRAAVTESTTAPLWTLRAVLCAMCAGAALHRWAQHDALSALLYVDLGWLDEPAANAVSAAAAAAYLLAGLALLTPWARPAALVVGAWTLVLLVVATLQETAWPETVFGSWAVRWLGPFALFAWLTRRARGAPAPGPAVEWTLRGAAAATFAFHGLKALGLHVPDAEFTAPHGEYLDFLATVERAVLDEALDQAANETLLRAIGVVDVGVAALLLTRRWTAIAAWMAFWGFATASVRIVEYEHVGFAKFLTRAPNGGVPLVLLLLWSRRPGGTSTPDPAQRR